MIEIEFVPNNTGFWAEINANSMRLGIQSECWSVRRQLALKHWGATFLGSGVGVWLLGFEDERDATLFILRWG